MDSFASRIQNVGLERNIYTNVRRVVRVLSNHQLLGRGGWPLAMISRLWEKDLGFLQFCEFYGDADTILALVGWLDVKCLRMIPLLLNWFHHTTSSMVYNVWRLDYCRWIRSEGCLFLNQRLIATTSIVAPVLYSSTAVVLTVPWDRSFSRAWNHANHDSALQGSHARGQGKLRKLERRCCSFFNEHIGTLPVASSETQWQLLLRFFCYSTLSRDHEFQRAAIKIQTFCIGPNAW